ncbi:MAG: hypothetical protein GY711_24195 [bacterium]|nr:hypothetical protein [bacterium]
MRQGRDAVGSIRLLRAAGCPGHRGAEGEAGPSKDWGTGARVTNYSWTAESGEVLTCTFQGDRLISKDPADSEEAFQ